MPHNFRALYSVEAYVQRADWKGGKAGKQNGNTRKMIWKSLLSTNVFDMNICIGELPTYLSTYLSIDPSAYHWV